MSLIGQLFEAQQAWRDLHAYFGGVVVKALLRDVSRHYGVSYDEAAEALNELPDWSSFASPDGWDRFGEYVAARCGVSKAVPAIRTTIH